MSSRVIAAERLPAIEPFHLETLGSASHRGRIGTARRVPGQDREELRAAAFDAGRQAGIEEGLRQAAEQQQARERQAARTLGQQVDNLLGAFERSLAEIDDSIGQALLKLAVDMASQVVRTHVDVNPDAVLPPLREALGELIADARQVTVRVAAADEDLVRQALDDLIAERRCEVRADPTVSPGGCRVDTPIATIDATLQTRWAHVMTAIGQSISGVPQTGTDREEPDV